MHNNKNNKTHKIYKIFNKNIIIINNVLKVGTIKIRIMKSY